MTFHTELANLRKLSLELQVHRSQKQYIQQGKIFKAPFNFIKNSQYTL